MNRRAAVARRVWLSYWNLMRVYHRYEVHGLDHLDGLPGPAMIVGYHGRPLAQDLCMLQAFLLERTGTMPSALVHDVMVKMPVLRSLVAGMQFVTRDEHSLRRLISEGRSVIVTPGGTREGCRSFRRRYQVDWGGRRGYLKLARRLRLPIVPTAARGTDDAFIGLVDGYRLGKALRLPAQVSPFLGLGVLGLWPLSPPFPVKITQRIGKPITDHLDTADAVYDNSQEMDIDTRIRSDVQNLLRS
jgi:1-acyl-sn-glycerol-3-phosphate acyltransferase